ncbi:MAG: BTAD domain-containing putative transcriptional regulator [Actinomycetota bacterium]
MTEPTTDAPWIRLLGSVEVDGGAVPIGGRTQQRILAYLLLNRTSVVTVDTLAEVTWPIDRPGRAEHNVRTYVHRLRSALGEDRATIETVTGGYRLTLADATVDTDRFEEHLATATRLQARGQHADALRSCEQALSLWLGPPLGDIGHESWAQPEVARLEELHQTARHRHAELLIAVGRPEQAVIDLRSIIEEHPSREGPQALLLRGLHASGRTTEALRAFQDYRSYLIDEVGVEPSPAIVELDRAIARGEPTDSPTPAIAGGYELHERIGEGAHGVVYRATQRLLDREVAVKVIRAQLANDPSFVRSFEAEARTVAGIDHPNVVPLFDFWRDPDQAFLVMPYLSGGSLAERLSDGPLPIDEALAVVDDVAAALSAAHQVGVVHLDVTPGNVHFAADGRAVLGDFGIASSIGVDGNRPTGSWNSSPQHAAPELMVGDGPVDERADVYGLAALTYSMLTGRSPYPGSGTPDELRAAKVAGPPDAGGAIGPAGAEVATTIAQATAADPQLRHATPQAFAAALRSAARITSRPAAPAERPANPYRGLRAFDEASAGLFHGRSKLVTELVERLDEAGTLAVVGPSGSGKSSAVRAGLLPALRRAAIDGSDRWFPVTMTPGAHPYEALETALLRVAVNPPDSLLDQLRDGDRGVLRAIQRVLPDDDAVLLLVIDQFEELYTNVDDPARADGFQRALATAVTEPGSPLRLVLTLRADFHDRPLRHATFAPVLTGGTVAVTPLAPDEMEEVIVEPARAVGVAFGPGVVAEIVADANDRPGTLPLLQYGLTCAFDQSNGREVTLDDYRAVGGIAGSLAQQAERLYADLDTDEQRRLRRVMGRLVALGEGTEDTRRVAERVEFGLDTATQRVIDRFGAARLFTFDHDPASREPTVEISHEALIRNWPRFRGWLDEDRDDLRTHRHLAQAADEWQRLDRADSELYRGGRLETAERWADDHSGDMRPIERDFVDTSVGLRNAEVEAEEQRFAEKERSNTRLRRALVGVAVVLALALIAGGLAFQQRSAAQATAFDAETSRLVATAQELASTNPRVAMLLAVTAHQRAQTPETLGALQTALSQAGPVLGYLGWGTNYIDVEWLVNGLIVGVRADGLDLFDPETGQLLDSFAADIGVGRGAPFTVDLLVSAASAAPVLVVAAGNEAVVVTADGRFEQAMGVEMPEPIEAVALSPTADTVVVIDYGSRARFVDRSGATLAELDVNDEQTFYDQAVPYLGERFWSSDFWKAVPPFGWLHPGDDGVVVQAGAYLTTFDWSGRQVGDRILVANDGSGRGDLTVGLSRTVLLDGLTPRLILSTRGVWTPEFATDDTAEMLVGRAVPELNGGGRDAMLELIAEQATALVVATDGGDAMRIDLATLDVESVIDESFGSSPGSAVNPRNQTEVAIASQVGVALASIGEAGPIASAVPRPREAGNVTISFDGRYAITGGTGALAPTWVWSANERGWERERSIPDEPTVYAGVVPGEEEPLWVGAAPLPTIGYDLRGAVPELYAAYEPEQGSTSGDTSSDRRWEALALFDARILDSPTGEVLRRLPPPRGTRELDTLTGVRFHPSDRYLLVSNREGTSELWDTSTWELVDDQVLAEADIALGYWNDDGTLMASASSDGRISIRDGETFEIIRTMIGTVGTSNSWNSGGLLFSQDSSLLLTNFDNTGRLWDVEAGEQIGRPIPTARGTNMGANYGETLQLITATEDHALVWNLDTERWPDSACRAAASNLTEDEWNQWGPRDEELRSTCPDFPGPESTDATAGP